MLVRRQDMGVLVMHYLGYSRIRNLLLRLQDKAVTRVVTFHGIQSGAIGAFKANLQFLKRCTNVVSLEDYFMGRLSSKQVNTVITFDDGYKSWVIYAMPLLKSLGLPATFFVSSGFVGLSMEEQHRFMQSRLMLCPTQSRGEFGLSVQDVRSLSEAGFEIGGHTVNHYNLVALNDRDAVRSEIVHDKILIEDMIGKKVNYFSYPFGGFANRQINLSEVLMEAGYSGAVTTVSGFNSPCTNPYLLCREITDAAMPGCIFRARAFGNYDAVRLIKQNVMC